MTIGRKQIAAWEGRLPIKLMLISNEVPNFNDPSGALVGRFIKLRFNVSFFGREDVGLKERLDAELTGIAARCVAAYRRLCLRERFVQPQSGEALDRAVLAESDPFSAMVLDCFEPDTEDGGIVSKLKADSVFEAWCRDRGRMDVYRSVPKNKFGERLTTIDGFAHVITHRPNGQPRCWLGMRLKPRKD
jgi:putative DNA primase/helicase